MDITRILELYRQNYSIREIAKKYNTYPKKIYFMLLEAKEPIRSKSEVQKDKLRTGKVEHPTKGKEHSEETKIKISKKVDKSWKNISDNEKSRRAKVAKDNWEKRSEASKKQFHELSAKAIRQSAETGSKLEIFLRDELKKLGYHYINNKTGLVLNDNLEVDIFIPELKTAIEIDGPSHYMPVWGHEKLQKMIDSDARKNGLLLNNGYVVIRIQYDNHKMSNVNKRALVEKLNLILESIKCCFPKQKERLIKINIC